MSRSSLKKHSSFFHPFFLRVSGFTLAELLIIISILVLLTALTLVFINPSVYFRQARDSQRVTDITTLRIAIARSIEGQRSPSLGTAGIVYTSLLDTETDCTGSNFQLPPLPAGYEYQCSTSVSDIQKNNGTGWLPVDISRNAGANLASLPLDPLNSVESNTYYIYVTNGNKDWMLASMMESRKSLRLTQNDGGADPERLEQGNNLTLWKAPYSMTSYWMMDEGSGTTLEDERNLNDGTLTSSPTWTSGEECMRDGCLKFDGTDDYVTVPHSSSLNVDDNFSVAFWAKSVEDKAASIIGKAGLYFATSSNGWHFSTTIDPHDMYFETQDAIRRVFHEYNTGRIFDWHHFVGTKEGDHIFVYLDGEFIDTDDPLTDAITNTVDVYIGCFNSSNEYCFNGYIDDVRLYGRALSAAEVKAIYRAMQ